jgi:Anthranilate phosphoribosyltransferase
VRTLFNILGPMINPARPSHLLMGVARPELVELVAETLMQSPLHRAAVVCGSGNYDEVTPIGPTKMALLHNGKVTPMMLDPQEFGIASCTVEDLAVSGKEKPWPCSMIFSTGRGRAP